jgi:hypothetical protein
MFIKKRQTKIKHLFRNARYYFGTRSSCTEHEFASFLKVEYSEHYGQALRQMTCTVAKSQPVCSE